MTVSVEKQRAAVSRADLVRLLAALPSEQGSACAALCGFVAKEEPRWLEERPHAIEALVQPLPPPSFDDAPGMLYRFETMTFTEDANDDLTTAPPVTPGLSQAELIHPAGSLFALPRPASLASWSKLWPVLRTVLQGARPGRDLDIEECMHRWGRGQVLSELPRVQRKVWADRAELWIDRSRRLTPFWSDQDEVWLRLRRCCGKSGLRLRILDVSEQTVRLQSQGEFLSGYRLEPGQRVLVLGDLGAYGSPIERIAWLVTGQRLRKKEAQISALVPMPMSRVPPLLAQQWSVCLWEHGRRAAGAKGPQADQRVTERAERLLRLCAPAAYVQLGLLRALRRLLPASEADASTEADVFAHHKVGVADAMGLVLLPAHTADLRQQFATREPVSLQAQVSNTIREWHQGLPAELLRIETLSWLALGSKAPPPGDTHEALAFADRLGSSLRGGLEDRRLKAVVARCAQMMLGALPDTAYQALPKLQPIFAGVFANQSGVRVPQGLTPQLLYSDLVWAEEKTWWSIRQVGAKLVFHRAPAGAWPSTAKGPGSPIAWLLTRSPHVFVKWDTDDFEIQHVLTDGLPLLLRARHGVTLRSDCSSVTIASWTKEPWATAAGRDRYGLWADAEVEGVAVRFRWIPPGRFLMGSPESEAGRHENEGLQHEVTLTEGRWLADAPCTQALWEAVMGSNPSYFVSPDRPVEQVSWDDCQSFVQKLNERVPGLEARLPSEAEWEQACRAGTQTATWRGDLEILGENHAPLLDEIAWYGGNSGQDFELENGWDSSSWPNKQYPHTKAGTHPVRTKAASPLGLFDMLGNVYEWCMDWYGAYGEEAVTNPPLPSVGPGRVRRGGSWFSYAQLGRAAYRLAYSPDFRDIDLGFRLARGQGSSQAPGGTGMRSVPVQRGAGRAPLDGTTPEAASRPARSADREFSERKR